MGRNKKERAFVDYNQEYIVNEFDKLNVTSEELGSSDRVIRTFYGEELLKEAKVSRKYELFDFKQFIKYALSEINGKFLINQVQIEFNGGIQQIILLSDEIEIGGDTYFKAFYILNSTDRSRIPNLDLGLYRKSDGLSFITKSGIHNKKHFKGITDHIMTDIKFNPEQFNNEIELIELIQNSKIKLSDLRDIILVPDGNGIANKSNHVKFDLLRAKLVKLPMSVSQVQSTLLRTSSMDMHINEENDILLDAYTAFSLYLGIYSTRDSFVIKTETELFLSGINKLITNKDFKKSVKLTYDKPVEEAIAD